MSSFDLVVKNGKVVIPGAGIFEFDIGVSNGKIASLGKSLEGAEEVDAGGNYVLPGIIDPHVHLGLFNSLEVEMEMETKSALIGGVTTVGCFMGGPDPHLGKFNDIVEVANAKANTDIIFHLGIQTPEQLAEVPQYIEKLGVISFKLYMAGIPGLIPDVDDGFLFKTFQKLASLGKKTVACVHAENPFLIAEATAEIEQRMGDGTLADWAGTHPNMAEEDAVRRAAYLSRSAGCNLYLVHVSTRESIQTLARIKPECPQVFVETTSPYLSINYDNPKGMLLKMVPPFREQASVDALWQGVSDNVVDTIGTDNVTMTKAVKGEEKGMWGAMPGYPAVGTHLPSVLHFGVNQRDVDLLGVVEKMTMNPARIFGLYPRKGTIAPGSDADLVIVDLNKERTVKHEEMGSSGDFSIFEGDTLKGWPVMTIKGGKVVVRDGKYEGSPSGKFISRSL